MFKSFHKHEKNEDKIELPPLATGNCDRQPCLPLRMNNPMLSRKNQESSTIFAYDNHSPDNMVDDCQVDFMPGQQDCSDNAPLLSTNNSNGQYHGDLTPPSSDEHCHVIRKVDQPNKTAKRRLIFASLVCLIFVIGEVVGESTHDISHDR